MGIPCLRPFLSLFGMSACMCHTGGGGGGWPCFLFNKSNQSGCCDPCGSKGLATDGSFFAALCLGTESPLLLGDTPPICPNVLSRQGSRRSPGVRGSVRPCPQIVSISALASKHLPPFSGLASHPHFASQFRPIRVATS